jgi:hypothetical protein
LRYWGAGCSKATGGTAAQLKLDALLGSPEPAQAVAAVGASAAIADPAIDHTTAVAEHIPIFRMSSSSEPRNLQRENHAKTES